MRLKAFIAATSAEAMQQVRAELGPNAVILSSDKEDDGSTRIIAGFDPVETPDPPAPSPAVRSPTSPGPAGFNGSAILSQVLAFHGVPESVSAALEKGQSGPDLTATLALRLEATFRFADLAERRDTAPLLLAGPPGVGKTLTVAKLAARAVIAGRGVRLITTDIASAGAIEQIAAFARPLNVELDMADHPPRLAAVVAKRRDPNALVIIDTQGINPFDKPDIDNLKGIIAAAKAEPILVLPAGGDANEMSEQASAFAELGCRRLIATRLDIARRLGGVLAAAFKARLALAECSASPIVAHELQPLSPLALARLLVADRSATAPESHH
jgi:flagellar biosynthesis protein FlhF